MLSCRALILLSLPRAQALAQMAAGHEGDSMDQVTQSLRGAIFQEGPGSGGDCGRRNQLGPEMGRGEEEEL